MSAEHADLTPPQRQAYSHSASTNYLIQNDIVSLEQADSASQQSATDTHHTGLISHWVDEHKIDSERICQTFADYFLCEIIDLKAWRNTQEYLNDTQPLCHSFIQLIQATHALPLKLQDHTLTLAVVDPTATETIQLFGRACQANVNIVLVSFAQLADHLDAELGIKIASHRRSTPSSTALNGQTHLADSLLTEHAADESRVIHWVDEILELAIRKQASDIHFEPAATELRVRMRIDGLLNLVTTHTITAAPQIITRLKVMSKLDIAERRLPQDGRLIWQRPNSKNLSDQPQSDTTADYVRSQIDMRISLCPVLHGEKAVIRILDNSEKQLNIQQLGMTTQQQDAYEKACSKSQGLILVTGPTGSGKTVTQYTALKQLNELHRNISTAEDPVEIILDGINQVHVNPKIDLTFASAMRAFLRQDPDVIMIGEIRDLDTAEMAVKAAQTGHLVFSTLHTNDAPQSLTRLENIGVAPHNIASSVSLIIAQRLTRQLCTRCKIPDDKAYAAREYPQFAEALAEIATIYQADPEGCRHCDSGYRGRKGVFQVLPISDAMREIMLSEHTTLDISKQAAKESVLDLTQHGMQLVMDGTTSLAEIQRVLSH